MLVPASDVNRTHRVLKIILPPDREHERTHHSLIVHAMRGAKVSIRKHQRRRLVQWVPRREVGVVAIAIGVSGWDITQHIVGRPGRHREVVRRPVVAVAGAVRTECRGGGVGLIVEGEVEAVGAVGAGVGLRHPHAIAVELAERCCIQRLPVNEVYVGQILVRIENRRGIVRYATKGMVNSRVHHRRDARSGGDVVSQPLPHAVHMNSHPVVRGCI